MLDKLKKFLRKLMLSVHTRDLEKGGWLSRYGFPASIFYFLNVLVFRMVLYNNLIPIEYFSYFILVFIGIQLALGSVIIAGWVKTGGYFLLVIFLMVILAALTILLAHNIS